MAISVLLLNICPPRVLVVSSIRPLLHPDAACYTSYHHMNHSKQDSGDPNQQVVLHTYRLEACAFIACTLATAFVTLYSQLDSRLENIFDASETMAVVVTWGFVVTQFAATMALLQEGSVIARDTFLLHVLTHSFGMIVACGMPPRMPLWTLACISLPLFQLIVAIACACTQSAMVLLVLQAFLDTLLFVGHRWDTAPTLMCLQNCRLTYMTGCCCVLQFAVMLPSITQ